MKQRMRSIMHRRGGFLILSVAISASLFVSAPTYAEMVAPLHSDMVGKPDLARNAERNLIVEHVPTGGTSPDGIIYNPVNKRLYVANEGTRTVTVVNPHTSVVEKTLYLPNAEYAVDGPVALTVDPQSGNVFVINHASPLTTIKLWMISRDSEIKTFPARWGPKEAGVGGPAGGAVYNPYTKKVYVTRCKTFATRDVLIFAPEELATRPEGFLSTGIDNIGSRPEDVTVNPETGVIYVANGGSGTVTIISPSHEVLTTLEVGKWPVGVTFANGYVYVANEGSDTVSIIDVYTNQVVKTLDVGVGPRSVVVNPVNHYLYVVNRGANTVSLFTPEFARVDVQVGEKPEGITVNPQTGKAYVTNKESSTLSIISLPH